MQELCWHQKSQQCCFGARSDLAVSAEQLPRLPALASLRVHLQIYKEREDFLLSRCKFVSLRQKDS